MKRYIHLEVLENTNEGDNIFGFANLNPFRAGLGVEIWSEHGGAERHKSDKVPRLKMMKGNDSISVSIEENPKILAKSSNIKKSTMKEFREGIKYVARNYDLFLKHYNDISWEFGDEELKDELIKRGDYK